MWCGVCMCVYIVYIFVCVHECMHDSISVCVVWHVSVVCVCVCCNLMFYDWCECVMSVLGTTKHS